MLEIARYESNRRVAGAVTLAALVSLLSALYVGLYPSIQRSGVDFDSYVESLPPAVQAAFGNASLTTLEGFLAIELYQFVWLLFMGMYVAYTGASLIASDIEHDRMDLLLSTPVSRSKVLIEKFASLVVPITALNVIVAAVVYGGVALIGESLSAVALAGVHLLSVPYLLACGSIGLGLSVVTDRADFARRGSLGLVFGLFLLDSISESTGVEWLGAVSPMRYYDPAAILVSGTYDWGGAALLLGYTTALVLASRARFRRMDIT